MQVGGSDVEFGESVGPAQLIGEAYLLKPPTSQTGTLAAGVSQTWTIDGSTLGWQVKNTAGVFTATLQTGTLTYDTGTSTTFKLNGVILNPAAAPVTNDVILYNGTKWLNSPATGLPGTLIGITQSATPFQTSLGSQALGVTTVGGASPSTGLDNVAIGYQALVVNTTGVINVAVGYFAMGHNGTGSYNSAFGASALSNLSTTSYNAAFGYETLAACLGSNNTALGTYAGQTLTTGSSNTIIGYNVASTYPTTGSNNILIGFSSAVATPLSGTNNYLNIGGIFTGYTLANQATAIQFTDLTNAYYAMNTQTGTDAVINHTFSVGSAISYAAAASSAHSMVGLSAYTLTLTGNAATVGSLNGLTLNIAAPTVTNATVNTVTTASTLYIAGAPIASGSETITNAYALHVASGASLFGGTLTLNGIVQFGGTAYVNGVSGSIATRKLYSSAGVATSIEYMDTLGNYLLSYGAVVSFTTGMNNFGFHGATAVTTGSNNIDMLAGSDVTTGSNNILIAGGSNIGASSASNVTLGVNALDGIGTIVVAGNVALGYRAAWQLKSNSNYNVIVGYGAGSGSRTAANVNCVFVGYNTALSLDNATGSVVIGNQSDAIPTGTSNALNIANFIFGAGLTGTSTTVAGTGIGIGVLPANITAVLQTSGANLASAVIYGDGTAGAAGNIYYKLNTQTATDAVINHTFAVGTAISYAAAAASTHSLMGLSAYTLTLTGNAATVTALNGLMANIAQPTVTNATVNTVTTASTLYIAGAPIASGSETITNAYALHVAAGLGYFGGGISGAGNTGALLAGTGILGTGNVWSATQTLTGSPALTLGAAAGNTGKINFLGTTSGTVGLTAAAAAGTWTLTLPTSAGTSGYLLQTDGTGVASWFNLFGTANTWTAGQALANTANLAFADTSGHTNTRLVLKADNNLALFGSNSTGGDVSIFTFLTNQASAQDFVFWTGINSIRPVSDNALPLGLASFRWKDFQAVTATFGGTVTTSNIVSTTTATTGTGWSLSSSTLTTGSLATFISTSTALSGSVNLNSITISGANANAGVLLYGLNISVTNTNATSGQNIALYLTASGATSNNIAVQLHAGKIWSDAAQTWVLPATTGSALNVVDAAGPSYFLVTTGALGTGFLQVNTVGLQIGGTAGTGATANQIWTASQGAATTTLYIGNASINVTSDSRIKDIIGPTTRSATYIFSNLQVVDFRWADPTDTAPVNRNSRGIWTGITAQQALQFVPWLVNAEDRDCQRCQMGAYCDMHPTPWQVDWSHEFGLVTLGFQEVYRRFETAEEKIARLEARVAELEAKGDILPSP